MSTFRYRGIDGGINIAADTITVGGLPVGPSGEASTLQGATWQAPLNIGFTTPNTGKFTTLQTTSDAAIGGNLTVTGTFNGTTPNNALTLLGATWASPQSIGSVVPAQGNFTSIAVTSSAIVPLLNSSFLLNSTWAVPAPIGSTTPNTGAFTSITVTSSTQVTNLNSSMLQSRDWSNPGTIGGGVAGAGNFSTLTTTSTSQVANLNSSTLQGSTWASPPVIGTTPNVATFTTLNCTTLTVASGTQVANLNSSFLQGFTWSAPNPIGSGTPNTGAFTTLTTTSTLSPNSIVGRTTLAPAGAIGEMAGTALAGTGGNSYSTRNTSTYTADTTFHPHVSVSLTAGTWLVGFNLTYQNTSVGSALIQSYIGIGGADVASNIIVNQTPLSLYDNMTLSIPIVITSTQTVSVYVLSVAAQTTTNNNSELWAVRIG